MTDRTHRDSIEALTGNRCSSLTFESEALARELDWRPTEAGANVALVRPYDPIVYERISQKKGVTVAALSQIAVDLLTSPGRGPNEGEALIEWMRANEHVWRA